MAEQHWPAESKNEAVKMLIDPATLPAPKNNTGNMGTPCNNCGGYGYTMKPKIGDSPGGMLPCNDCRETGVMELTKEQLEDKVANQSKQINDLIKDFGELRGVVLETLKQLKMVRGEDNNE